MVKRLTYRQIAIKDQDKEDGEDDEDKYITLDAA